MLRLIFAIIVSVGTMSAQSTYTINATPAQPFPCSYTPSVPYCYALPIIDNSTEAIGKVFLLNGNLSFMNGYEGLGTAIYTSNDGMGHINFEGSGYTGSIDFTFTTYLCGRWHTQHCWEITGGTVNINHD